MLGISEFDEANRYLEEVYIPFWNERFAVEPAEPRDVHRRLPKRFDLESLFAETLTRTIGHDFTITYKGRKLQIAKSQARGIRPGHKLTIELRLDGSARYRWKNRYLDLDIVAKAQLPAHPLAFQLFAAILPTCVSVVLRSAGRHPALLDRQYTQLSGHTGARFRLRERPAPPASQAAAP